MSAEIMGVPVERLREPIQKALSSYEEKSGGDISFDIVPASDLILTPEKPNSARSATEAKYKSSSVGTLYVIAFKPQDGTGDEKTYKLQDLEITAPYPCAAKAVPRSKAGIYNEGHLTVVSHKIDDVHADPILFDGLFDLLGLQEHKVLKIGTLGQSSSKVTSLKPTATFTTGYDTESKRFGDPHAVFSLLSDRIQVCAFLAISEAINQEYADVLKSLNPQFPIPAR